MELTSVWNVYRSIKLEQKIKFSKCIAESVMLTMELLVKLSIANKGMTTDELIVIRESMREKYYNNKVELE